MNQPSDLTVELLIARDPRAELLGRVAVVRSTISERDREILDHIADRYKRSLGDAITAERAHTRYRAGLERLLELITTAPSAEELLTEEPLRQAFSVGAGLEQHEQSVRRVVSG